MTLKGQGQNLTSGQGRSRSRGGPSRSYIMHQSLRLDETNALTAILRLYLLSIASYWQKTVGDLE